MSESTLSKAWQWSVIHSPILNLWRWMRHMGYPNHLAFRLLDAAGLPKPTDALIRKTVIKSKLWATERAEIARELIAHTQDAIETGRTGEEIVSTFGDPKRIAKLMRRSMKRKRPLYWRAYRNMKRASAAMVVVLIVGYGGLAARFYMGTPSVKRNFIAELNAQNDGYAEDQKAWGVYRDVDLQWKRLVAQRLPDESKADRRRLELYRIKGLEQENADYALVRDMVRSFGLQIDRLREASARPIMGLAYATDSESIEIEPGIWVWESAQPLDDPKDQGLLLSVLLPDLSIGKGHVNLLLFDAKLAFEQGDSTRAIEDVMAVLGIGRQIGQNNEFLISSLVAIGIVYHLADSLQLMIAEYPELVSRDQLVELSHAFAQTKDWAGLSMKGETMIFEDVLQRAYTDDGHGNGRITAEGVKMLADLDMYSMLQGVEDPMTGEDYLRAATSPGGAMVMEDRQTQRRRYLDWLGKIEQAISDGPESLGWLGFEESKLDKLPKQVFGSPMEVLLPSIARRVGTEFIGQMRTDALLTMLAIEVFEREHGRYPQTLEELVPRYMPVVPTDWFHFGHPIQYVLDGDGYLLYSAGTDGDLDGGRKYEGSEYQAASSIWRRSEYQTVRVDGRLEVLRDDAGHPMYVNPSEPDCDWVLVDMRSASESSSGE